MSLNSLQSVFETVAVHERSIRILGQVFFWTSTFSDLIDVAEVHGKPRSSPLAFCHHEKTASGSLQSFSWTEAVRRCRGAVRRCRGAVRAGESTYDTPMRGSHESMNYSIHLRPTCSSPSPPPTQAMPVFKTCLVRLPTILLTPSVISLPNFNWAKRMLEPLLSLLFAVSPFWLGWTSTASARGQARSPSKSASVMVLQPIRESVKCEYMNTHGHAHNDSQKRRDGGG